MLMINNGKWLDQKDGWLQATYQNNSLSLTCHHGYRIKQEDLSIITRTYTPEQVTEGLALINVQFDSEVVEFCSHFHKITRLNIFNQVTYDFAVFLRLIPSITHLKFFDVDVIPAALFCGLPRTRVTKLYLHKCRFTNDQVEAEWFSQLAHLDLVDVNDKLPINQILEYGNLVGLTVEAKRHHGEFVEALLKAKSVKNLFLLRTDYYGPSGWENIYHYFREDCILESFTRLEPNENHQELMESIKYHPRLKEVIVYSMTPEVDRRLLLNQSIRVRRTVELLGSDVLPMDIVRHVYGFIN
jgi:hypothetical protein